MSRLTINTRVVGPKAIRNLVYLKSAYMETICPFAEFFIQLINIYCEVFFIYISGTLAHE